MTGRIEVWTSDWGRWLQRRRRLSSLVEVTRQVAVDARTDRVTGLAAEVAFFALLSIFPSLLAVAAGLGAVDRLFGPEVVARAQHEVIEVLTTFLTDQATGTVDAVRQLFVGASGGVFTFGVLGALWAASRGMAAILRTIAQIYDVEETRSRTRTRVVAAALVAASMLLFVITLAAIVLGPLLGAGRALARWVGMERYYGAAWEWVGLPVAFVALLAWAAVVFHSVPHRHVGWWHHVAGAAFTGLLWISVSVALRLYLQLFGGNPVFGVLGGALVVLVWLYLLSLALLIGAELNAVLADRGDRSHE